MNLKYRKVKVGLAMLTLTFVSLAEACPLCHTGTGQQVRQGIMDQNFFFNVTATLTPFFIIAIVISIILYEKPKEKSYESEH